MQVRQLMSAALAAVSLTLASTVALAGEDMPPVGYGYDPSNNVQPAPGPDYGLVPLGNAHGSIGHLRFGVPELFAGVYHVAFDYKLSNTVAVGPVYKYMNDDDGVSHYYGAEMIVSLDENLNQSGWQIAPYIAHVSGDYDSDTDQSANLYGVNFIHQHIWPIGLMLDTAIGVVYTTNSDIDLPMTIHGDSVTPMLTLTVGYAL